MKELLTNYGDIFEVWFDGANGGDGFYGGAYEDRRVDKKTYYDWTKTIKIIRIIFRFFLKNSTISNYNIFLIMAKSRK